MTPTQHSSCNDVLEAPRGATVDECKALAITRGRQNDVPFVMSFWMPDAEELALLNAGKPVAICVQGYTHSPMWVSAALTK